VFIFCIVQALNNKNNNKKNVPNSDYKYYRQVIIYLVNHDKQSMQMYDKCINVLAFHTQIKQSNDNHLIPMLSIERCDNGTLVYDQNNWREILAKLTCQSRIYIVGHCDSGLNVMEGYSYSGANYAITAAELANLILQGLAYNTDDQLFKGKARSDTSKLRISLLACSAGSPDLNAPYNGIPYPVQINNSFAACLLFEMDKKGIRCDVAARTGPVFISNKSTGRKAYTISNKNLPEYNNDITLLNKLNYLDHDPRSKVIYTVHSGRQVIKMAYGKYHHWRETVFDTIIDCIARTKSLEKKQSLLRLLNDCVLLTDQDIYKKLTQIVNQTTKEQYAVHLHTDWIHCTQTRTAKRLREVLASHPT
jgi:hypothetical protein